MTSEGLGEMEMFEGDFADTCAEKFPVTSVDGRAEGLACTGPGARTTICVSGNFHYHLQCLENVFVIYAFKNLTFYFT